MANKGKKEYKRFGAMLQGKDTDEDGNKTYYVQLEDEFAQALGNKYIRVERPDAALVAMLKKGDLDEQQFEERCAKIPDFVKFNFTLVKELD
jgi:hypothetical protein